MTNTVLGSVAVMSLVALMSGGCSPALSQPKAVADLEMTSITTLTSAAPLPPNHAPLEAWGEAKPDTRAAAPVVSTWDTPAQPEATAVPAQEAKPVAAPAQPAVQLDPWPGL